MTRSLRSLCLTCAFLLVVVMAGCAGNRMNQSTEKAAGDSLLANKVRLALYADAQLSGRQIRVEASQGVIQLYGVTGSAAEARRAEKLAQEVEGVKEVRNHLTAR